MFIVKESIQREFLVPKQSFFAVPIELPDAIVQRVLRIQADAKETGEYLALVKINQAAEVPECLEEEATPVVVKDSPPKKKASAPTSRKKSATSSKKTVAKGPATNQPKGA